jgi:hypothetical protein
VQTGAITKSFRDNALHLVEVDSFCLPEAALSRILQGKSPAPPSMSVGLLPTSDIPTARLFGKPSRGIR